MDTAMRGHPPRGHPLNLQWRDTGHALLDFEVSSDDYRFYWFTTQPVCIIDITFFIFFIILFIIVTYTFNIITYNTN